MSDQDVLTVHHGVDTEEFHPVKAAREKIRAELGLQDHHLLVGFAGRFSPGKGHEEFLHAAAVIRDKHPQVRFAIVGEASYGEEPYERSIRNLSRSLSLDGVLFYTGFRKDIRDVMAAFDIFAFPSHAEAFGAVLIEAMALQRPVVSSNCDGVLDIVVDGETGIFMTPGNPTELVSGLERLISDSALRIRMGQAGRRRVEKYFDKRKLIERMERIYSDGLADGVRAV
jgi:glycosyltransferase involved in cell wall biosynthesis